MYICASQKRIMKTIIPSEMPTSQLHGFLQSSVGPRPIALASTMDKDGNPNLSPFSFFNLFSSNPPVLIFSPSRRVRDNSIKHTLMNAEAIKEVVINVVNFEMVQQTSLSSTEYAKGVNEFDKSGLTPIKSDLVKPFRVAESPVQFECKVNEIIALGSEGGAGNLIICEILKMHIDESVLDASGNIDQHKIDLVSRLGGNWYSRSIDGLFEVPKPLTTLGVGIDRIPQQIVKSSVLTGNDLGILGNVEQIPTPDEVAQYVTENFEIKAVLSADDDTKQHELAQEYIRSNRVDEAWKILLAQRKNK